MKDDDLFVKVTRAISDAPRLLGEIDARTAARAVVAVLPTADVSDEAIGKALEDDTDVDPAECPGVMGEECPTGRHHHHSKGGTHRGTRETCELLGCYADRARTEGPTGTYPAVRALLDAQAAAHAAEVERLNDSLDYANKGKAELEAEVEALRAKHEEAVIELELCRSRFLMLKADRDRAVREALESAAQKVEQAPHSAFKEAARIVRSLIPEGDTE